jgi:hypothetical protein
MSKKVTYTPSMIYQSVFYLKQEPLSYDSLPFWIPILDSNRLSQERPFIERRMVLKCSRQVAKSTNLAIMATGNSIMRNNFKTIICQPTDTQISRFSVDVLKTINTESIVTEVFYYDNNLNQNQVMNKSYTTGSRIILANIYSSILSARGISSDCNFFDEYQDIPPENADIVLASMKRSPFKYAVYSGTPKEHENDLQTKFTESTQCEWAVPCRACGKWNVKLDISNIGKKFVICRYCGAKLNVRLGQWVVGNSNGTFAGYHINELMVPSDTGYGTDLSEIHYDLDKGQIKTVMNEILGESWSDSKNPISKEAIAKSCNATRAYIKDKSEITSKMRQYSFAGIDWALGTKPGIARGQRDIRSYTMLTIMHYDFSKDKLVVDFVKKYFDKYSTKMDDPDYVIKDMIYWVNAFNCTLVGMDYGAGHKENQRIISALGYDRCMEFQYMGDELQDKIRYLAAQLKWIVPRTLVMNMVIDMMVKDFKYEFAKMDGETSEYMSDLTNIYEYGEMHKRQKRYGKTGTDDWMHSIIFATLAYLYAFQKLPYVVAEG